MLSLVENDPLVLEKKSFKNVKSLQTDGRKDRLTGQKGPEKRRCAKNVNDHVLVRYLFEVGFLIVYILILFFLAFLWFTSTDR